jgi:hypothetical protein
VLGHRPEAHRAAGPEPHVVDGITQDVATTDSACDEFLEKYPSWPAGIHVYGDCNGRNRDVRSHKSNYTIIEERLSAAGPVTLCADAESAGRRSLSGGQSAAEERERRHAAVDSQMGSGAHVSDAAARALAAALEGAAREAGRREEARRDDHARRRSARLLDCAEWPVPKPESRAGGMSVDWLN